MKTTSPSHATPAPPTTNLRSPDALLEVSEVKGRKKDIPICKSEVIDLSDEEDEDGIEDEGEDNSAAARETLAVCEDWEKAKGVRKLEECAAYGTRKSATDTKATMAVKTSYFMIYILPVDLLTKKEEIAALQYYQVFLCAAKADKRLQASAVYVDDHNQLKARYRCSLDPRFLQKIECRDGTVVQKFFLCFALFAHWNPFLLPLLAKCNLEDLVRGLPAISIAEMVAASRTFDPFYFETKIRCPVKKQEQGETFLTISQSQLRGSSGVYVIANEDLTKIRIGMTASSFESRMAQHFDTSIVKGDGPELMKDLVRSVGKDWKKLIKACIAYVPARHRGLVIDKGIIFAIEAMAIILTSATNPAQGGANQNVVDIKPYVFHVRKATYADMETLYLGIWKLAKSEQDGLPSVHSVGFAELISPINEQKLSMEVIKRLIEGKMWKGVREKHLPEINMCEAKYWLLRREPNGTVVQDRCSGEMKRKRDEEDEARRKIGYVAKKPRKSR